MPINHIIFFQLYIYTKFIHGSILAGRGFTLAKGVLWSTLAGLPIQNNGEYSDKSKM